MFTPRENNFIDEIKKSNINYIRNVLTRCLSPPIPKIDINFYNQYNEKPLMIAVSCQKTSNELIQILLEHGAETNMKNIDEDTALHLACSYGTADTVKQLLLHGADPNSKNRMGHTPLYDACRCTNEDKIKYLFEYNACPNSQDEDGNSVLHWLANCGSERFQLMKMLLDYGADVKLKNRWGETPLFCFVGNPSGFRKNICFVEVCKLLLMSNSDVNIQLKEPNKHVDVVGDTLLHCAIRNKHFEVAQMILDSYNPSIYIQNQENETAHDIARKLSNVDQILCSFERIIHYAQYTYLFKTWITQRNESY